MTAFGPNGKMQAHATFIRVSAVKAVSIFFEMCVQMVWLQTGDIRNRRGDFSL
jgi:hypothetical protein